MGEFAECGVPLIGTNCQKVAMQREIDSLRASLTRAEEAVGLLREAFRIASDPPEHADLRVRETDIVNWKQATRFLLTNRLSRDRDAEGSSHD